jgi:exodeoxyribonuclease V alpha subunit
VADTIDDRPCVFLRGLYLAERGIADRLQALSKGSPPWPKIDIDKAVPWVEKKTGKILAVQVDIRSDRRRELAVVASGGVAFLAGLKLT